MCMLKRGIERCNPVLKGVIAGCASSVVDPMYFIIYHLIPKSSTQKSYASCKGTCIESRGGKVYA